MHNARPLNAAWWRELELEVDFSTDRRKGVESLAPCYHILSTIEFPLWARVQT